MNNLSDKVWRAKNRTLEFECYMMEDEGHILFVGFLWAKPNVYSFGNGDAKFSLPDLYDWLTKHGMIFEE